MGILRWILTISFLGLALSLALILIVMLVGVYFVMRLSGALKMATVRVDENGRVATPRESSMPMPARRNTQSRAHVPLPQAPDGAEIFHMRAWDDTENRAIDRWYYKDEGGQWIFVQPPAKS